MEKENVFLREKHHVFERFQQPFLQKVTTSEPKNLQKVTTLWLKILQKVTAITDKQANISKLIKNEGINHKSGIFICGRSVVLNKFNVEKTDQITYLPLYMAAFM